MRHTRAVILACALLGAAPAIHAQSAASLKPTIGSPISYSIGLPKGWDVQREDGMLMVSFQGAAIAVGAVDLAVEAEDMPVSDAERRRILTSMIMGSDSLLFGLLVTGMAEEGRGMQFEEAEREIRTLGGERAAYIRGQCGCAKADRILTEAYLTVKDGIMYILILGAAESEYRRHEPLFARVRDSFALASAPAPAPRTIEPPREATGRHRDGTWTSR